MFKTIQRRVWAFDLEWVPDPLAGRLLYPEDTADGQDEAAVMRVMWDRGGADEEDPTPFLKTALCRIVSVAAVERRILQGGEIALNLMSLPHDPADAKGVGEGHIVAEFLDALGTHQPQLVGFNSRASDLKILVQRAVILGLEAEGFCRRPNKPWEGVDYFARGSEANVDLKDIVGGWGLASPSLHEVAVQSGIPGKMDVDGNQVAQLWLDGDLKSIVDYNEFDALTTYLLWLRLAHLGGFFNDETYDLEQRRVEDLIDHEVEAGRAHLQRYRSRWDDLRSAISDR